MKRAWDTPSVDFKNVPLADEGSAGGSGGKMSRRIAVLVTCHNRREQTLRCMRLLHEQRLPADAVLQVVLVDDGSTDGTGDAVRAEFPDALVATGSGHLYWNGGMRKALVLASTQSFEFFLLLNDDTMLYADAVANLLTAADALGRFGIEHPIVVGSTEAPLVGGVTYGGWQRKNRWNALRMRRMVPGSELLACDMFDGNCVLIPEPAMRSLDGLDPAFTHSMSDTDLGLRAGRKGFRSFLAPGYVGACEHNTGRGLWTDQALPVLERWRRLLGPKGLPPAEWLTFTSRHAGPLWPIYWINPYAKFWLRAGWRLIARRLSIRCVMRDDR